MFRLPEITPLQQTQVGNPEVSMRAMTSKGMALSGLGEQLTNISDQFFGTALQLQKLENARLVTEKQMALESAWTQHQIDLQKDPSPQSRIERTRQFFEANRGLAQDPNLPPAVRDELGEFYSKYEHKNILSTAEDAARLEIRRTSEAMRNQIDGALRTGDMESVDAAVNRMLAAGAILPEEADGIRARAAEKIAVDGYERDILADASGWLDANPLDKVPKGIDPGKWRTLHNMARTEKRNQIFDDTDGVLELIHRGDIADDASLEKAAGHLPAVVQSRLREQIQMIQRENHEELINSPAYQQQIVGEVSQMLKDYNPAAEGYDKGYVDIDAKIRTLPTSNPVRDELQKALKAKRNPEEGESAHETGAYAFATNTLDAAAKAGRFGRTELDLQRTEKAINDGFLRDQAKLKRVGMSAEQVAEINAPVKLANDKEREPTDSERRARFERLWVKRAAPPDEAKLSKDDAYAMATAKAIVEQQTYVPSEEETRRVEAVHRRIGEVRMQLAQWVKMNPKATPAEIEKKAFDLAGFAARAAAASGMYPPPPSQP